MAAKFVALIFASLLIQNEACTRLLQRLQQQMSQMPQMSRLQQPSRRTGQIPSMTPTTSVSPGTPTTQISPTRISRPETDFPRDLAGSSDQNALQMRKTSPDATPANSAPSPNYASFPPSNWNPNLIYSSVLNYASPSNAANGLPSTWNTRQLNAVYRWPKSDVGGDTISTDMSPRSLTSVLPGLMNVGTGLLPGLTDPSLLARRLSRLPSDLSDATRDVTSALSDATPGVASALSSIPNTASDLSTGVTSALSPSRYLSRSSLSSIPGLIYLASAFSNWMNGGNSTDASTRSSSSAYTLMSYIPGLLSALSVIAPFLPSFGASNPAQPVPPSSRSPLSAITSIPGSLLGLSGLMPTGDRNRPYGGFEKNPNRRDKSRVRPGAANQYYEDDLNRERYSNELPDEREDYRYNNRMDDRYQQQSKNRPSSTQKASSSYKPSSGGQNRRGDARRRQYNNNEYD